MAKKKSSTTSTKASRAASAARKTTRASRAAGAGYRGKALEGKAKAGKLLEPGQAVEANAPALAEVKEPRPYTSRYPIPDEEFASLEYLVNSAFPSGNYLTLWRIANAAAAPILTRVQVPASPYSLPPNADQSGGPPPLNTGDVRALHAVFRGDSVWTAFTTAHNWGVGPNRAAIQWCQIRAAAPALVQQGVFGSSNFHYFYPASCPDGNGNMTMVFSRCGPSEFGSILYAGRRSTDPLGILQASALLKSGAAHYVALDSGGRNRWGDYNGVASDPANGRLVWFYSMYASAANTWGTWVGSAFF